MSVWTVKGGIHGELEDRFLESGLIGGGWPKLGDLAPLDEREKLREAYAAAYPEHSAKQQSNYVGQLWSLRSRMQEDDLVVVPLKTTGTVAVGRISGPYAYRDDLVEGLRHTRPVSWLKTDVSKDAFDQDLLYSFGAFLTFGQVRRDHADERVLAALNGEGQTVVPPSADDGEDEPGPNVPDLAREQVRQRVGQVFVGHDLADLIAAIFAAQGFTEDVSPPGPDGGIDILLGSGATGRESPRIVVQVKSGQGGINEYRSLVGIKGHVNADYGLLVAWGGFQGTVRREARQQPFEMLLWDADDVLDALFEVFDRLREDLRSRLPLQRVWALVPTDDV